MKKMKGSMKTKHSAAAKPVGPHSVFGGAKAMEKKCGHKCKGMKKGDGY